MFGRIDAADYIFDDNADDSYAPNYVYNSAPRLVNRLFRLSARSWRCVDNLFVPPLVARSCLAGPR
jgi:hypothetical protein